VELANGSVAWEVAVASAIEVPLRADPSRADNDTLFVATAGAVLYAFSFDGELLWQTELLAPVRTAPALDAANLYLVDAEGWLYAFARATGRLVWRSEQPLYLGPPIYLTTREEGGSTGSPQNEFLMVASASGTLSAITTSGELLRQWQVYAAEDRHPPSFTLGLSYGGGALWIGDDHAVIRRLGPPATP
jgi:outer membrane protein assembly factor BamB